MDRQQSLADWFSAPNSKLFAGNYVAIVCARHVLQRRMEPMGTERKAVRSLAQVVKVGCIAIRSEETEDFSFKQP